jgi:hypothetical protein
MSFLGSMLVVLQALAAGQQGSPHPVVVVDDPREARHAIGERVDGIFTPSQDEAEAPRRDLARYLEAERRQAKGDNDRQDRLRRIGIAMDQYFWHCAGYSKDRQRYLFCSFVRFSPSDLSRLRQNRFPVIADGGISVCHCHFSMKRGQIVRLEWNGES